MALPRTKQADSKGRVTLGEAFANRTLMVEERDDVIILRLARVIPEREAWLYENPEALAAVRRGLAQAKGKKQVKGPAKGPDLGKAARLAEQLKDE